MTALGLERSLDEIYDECHLKSRSPFMHVMSGHVNNVLNPLFGGKYFKKLKIYQKLCGCLIVFFENATTQRLPRKKRS